MATSMMASNIARDLFRVIDAARGADISVVDLRKELLHTTNQHLIMLFPLLENFASINIDPVFVAKTVASKINKNEALQRALPRDNYITSRSIDQLVVSWGREFSMIRDGPEGIIDWCVVETVLKIYSDIPNKICVYIFVKPKQIKFCISTEVSLIRTGQDP